MSEVLSYLLSWVTLLLYLSSMALQVSGTQPLQSQQPERRGINENTQPYSQGTPLPSIIKFYLKQGDRLDWISVSEVNQRPAIEKVTGEKKVLTRETNERATSSRLSSEMSDSKRINSEGTVCKKVTNERVPSEKGLRERSANKRILMKRAISSRVTNAKAITEKATVNEDAGILCAYRVTEKGEEGRLCFRQNQVDFTCPSSTCRQVRSPGGQLLANMLSNGSVLLQWTYDGWGTSNIPGNTRVQSEAPGLTVTPTAGGGGETLPTPPKNPTSGQQTQRRGFRMSCWWNGSYTPFECASVILGSSCRDFLLTELHENVPYRICLQPLWAVWNGAETGKPHEDKMKTIWDGAGCVDFSISPSGMQDIVIAMTTVGGAICVMLVIICLLVAYITENIMSPSVQHTLTARHSTRSHNTHL